MVNGGRGRGGGVESRNGSPRTGLGDRRVSYGQGCQFAMSVSSGSGSVVCGGAGPSQRSVSKTRRRGEAVTSTASGRLGEAGKEGGTNGEIGLVTAMFT